MHRSRYIKWTPALGAGTLGVIFLLYYALLGPEPDDGDIRFEIARILWASSSMILNVIMIWCIVASWKSIRRYAWHRLTPAHKTVGGAVALGLLCGLGYMLINQESVVGTQSATLLDLLFARVEHLEILISINNLVGVIVIVSLLFAAISFFVDADEDDEVRFAARLRWFRLTFYSAGALAAVALYQFFRLYGWSALAGAAGIADPAEAEAALRMSHALATSIAMASGLILSCLLALIFLPAALYLNAHFGRLVSASAQSEPNFNKATWMEKYNIGTSPIASLGSYAAVFLPSAVGFVAKIVDLVS